MVRTKPTGRAQAMLLSGVLCLVMVVVGLVREPRAQSSDAPPLSATEQAAIKVVRGWLSGWDTKNPERVASFMADDVFWAGGFPTNPAGGIWRTGDRFVQQDGPATRTGVKFSVVEELAVGGSAGTAILQRRIDEGAVGPYEFGAGRGGAGMFFTNAVLYWVKDGKIQIWLDGPISPNATRDKAPPLDAWAADEKAALEVVKGWVAAWNAKDPGKVASYMADDAQYSAYYPFYITERGKSHFLDAHRANIAQGVDMRIAQSLAVGGPRGIGVMLRRIDRFASGGRQREVPTAAFFWVSNGKIETWLDLPLETPPMSAAGAPVVR